MNIRTWITLWFISIVAVIIFFASLLIYALSADYRRDSFYSRLKNKAVNSAKLLIEVDEVDINLLRKIEKVDPGALDNEEIMMFGVDNKTVYSSDKESFIRIDLSLLDRVRAEEEIRYRQGEYEVLGFLFNGAEQTIVVIAAATDTHGINKLNNLKTVLIIVFAFSILAASVSGWFFSGKALQPISRVVRQVDDIGISSLNVRVDEGNGRDEIAILSKTFNRMLSRLETSFNVQKDFIANASHELRTPLTSITGQLEVALLDIRSGDEYQKVVMSVLEDIKTLNQLSHRLLLLAQTDANQRKSMLLRIDEMVWQARDEVVRRNHAYMISIDLDPRLDDDRLTISGDEQLIKTAIANILENGCKYSADHAVHLLIHADDYELLLEFTDSGIGIPTADLENIFEPFYRAENAKSIRGSGIGLSLVKRIVSLHGGKVVIRSDVNIGTTVTLKIPLAARKS
ncbi:MAG: HAMP domain-containing histidine kinase [Cyclobacteriaceae bacterium]|nr:HAMP domain-containing histidine kinase [Cyclobacteriaceae bacterium]